MSVPTAAQSWQQRELGLERSASSAGIVWRERALGYLREFVARHRAPFLAEHVRAYAESRGFADPPTAKSWGPVMQRAARERIIVAHAYAPARSSNGSPKVLWRAA
jgi:hypothetical protein